MMERTIEDIEQRVLQVIANHFTARRPTDAEAVTTSTHLFDDLHADSLDLVELVMELEERFDIVIPEAALEGGRYRAGDYVALVERFSPRGAERGTRDREGQER